MYIKFKQTGSLKGKSFKKDEVRYETNAQRFIDAGVAEEVDYEKYHEENLKGNNITLKDAPKKESE